MDNPRRAQEKEFVFCTIITKDYFPFVYALYDSMISFHNNVLLVVLVSNATKEQSHYNVGTGGRNILVLYYDSLCNDGYGKVNFVKYHSQRHDAFRWAMKPVLLLHLLQSYDKVVYVDSDISFYSEYLFLFKLLDTSSVLLSPHFRSSDPIIDYSNYILQFNNGIFNGGFVGVNRAGVEQMKWWAHVCNEICEVDLRKGQFVDQTHLNLLPVYFEGVHILKHRGCNVANWNQVECKRINVKDSVMINGEYPIVFIHFTKSTVRGIMAGSDTLLRPFLDIYLNRLKSHGVSLDWVLPRNVAVPFYKKMAPLYVGRFIKSRLRKFRRAILLGFCY